MARRKIGQNKNTPVAPAVPAEPKKSLYVVYYWSGKDGETDIDNIVVEGLLDLGSLPKIQAVLNKIAERHPDPEYYTKITIQNWWLVEGSIHDIAPAPGDAQPLPTAPPVEAPPLIALAEKA